MKISKCDFFDILVFDNAVLKEKSTKLYELKQSLLRDISERITEDSHVEINFIQEEE